MRQAALSKADIESEIAGRFGPAFKLRTKAAPEVISTGISAVDSLTGGFPRGAITEIFGPASSGRTSLLLSALAHATTHDEVCALIDTSNAFDPASAARVGVDLQRLLWIRCDANLEHAFKATDLLLQGGGFGFVTLDIGDLPGQQARRIITSWWYRIRRVVENTPTAFVVMAEESCVRSAAAMILKLDGEASVWSSVVSTNDKKSGALSEPKSQLQDGALQYCYSSSMILTKQPATFLLQGIRVRAQQQKPVGFTGAEFKPTLNWNSLPPLDIFR